MATNMLEPTAQEQYMLELINRARLNPNAEVQRNPDVSNLNEGLAPGTISDAPKQVLAFDLDLIEAARDHSQWMLDTDQFAHQGAGGSSAGDRMKAAGYEFTGSWTWGENLAYQGTTGTPDVDAIVTQQHAGLFDSPGHRTNLMNGTFKEIGIGIETGDFRGYNAVMTTQNFAKSGTDTFLTGVAYTDAVTDDDFYTVGEGIDGITITAVRESDQKTVQTETFASGGYQMALEPGVYKIEFSGGNLGQPVSQTITFGEQNMKLDLPTDELVNPTAVVEAAPQTQEATPVPSPTAVEAPVTGPSPVPAGTTPMEGTEQPAEAEDPSTASEDPMLDFPRPLRMPSRRGRIRMEGRQVQPWQERPWESIMEALMEQWGTGASLTRTSDFWELLEKADLQPGGNAIEPGTPELFSGR